MERKVTLVFAILTLVFGIILMTGWGIILIMDITLKATFPGTTMQREGIISFYLLFSFGITFIAASILLFVVRTRKTN